MNRNDPNARRHSGGVPYICTYYTHVGVCNKAASGREMTNIVQCNGHAYRSLTVRAVGPDPGYVRRRGWKVRTPLLCVQCVRSVYVCLNSSIISRRRGEGL
jgi:hypothetical protein